MTGLYDRFGRRITYLRVSVTDKCNLRCVYCMPEEGIVPRSHDEILRIEEIVRVIRVATGLGINKIRVTGGEPLVRKGVVDLVRMVAAIPGVQDLSMTTNATLLRYHARDLAKAGLRRVNVSLDTLRPDVYAKITRRGDIRTALEGIAAAEVAGLRPLRLNAVVVRGMNDGEIEDLARLTLTHAWDVRFIEFMPFWGNGGSLGPSQVVPIEEIRGRVVDLGPQPCSACQPPGGAGPATYLRLPGAMGRVGFISREGDGFCVRCNRLRLTADGKLLPCLLAGLALDLRGALRGGAGDDDIAALIRKAVALKPESGAVRGDGGTCSRRVAPPLSDIGG
ncbi:MAG: GTP 3',8-cyclase MoaA [Bacteroidota bacterium]